MRGTLGALVLVTVVPSTAGARPGDGADPDLEAKARKALRADEENEKPEEADEFRFEGLPPPPAKRGLVVGGEIGPTLFVGAFGHVTPPAPTLHGEVAFEPVRWIALGGEAELLYASTGMVDDPPKERAFPIVVLSGVVRFQIALSDRVSLFAAPSLGMGKAIVAAGALANLGFRDAESFEPLFGLRAGLDWFQRDPHYAIGFALGAKDAIGFVKRSGSDTAILASLAFRVRYTF